MLTKKEPYSTLSTAKTPNEITLVFPTLVGVFLWDKALYKLTDNLPHASGGVSKPAMPLHDAHFGGLFHLFKMSTEA